MIDVNTTMRRGIPILIAWAFVSWLVAAVTLGVIFPSHGAVSFIGGLVAGVALPYLMYTRRRIALQHQYGEQQRLILSPTGLRRVDNALAIDMPWSGLSRVEERNSSLPGGRTLTPGLMNTAVNNAISNAHTVVAAGIVGTGTLAPLPGAPGKLLKQHDRLYGSSLRNGEQHNTDSALIFPSEFEHDWINGAIGAWLDNYRPDVLRAYRISQRNQHNPRMDGSL